jgi:hypothetical protein
MQLDSDYDEEPITDSDCECNPQAAVGQEGRKILGGQRGGDATAVSGVILGGQRPLLPAVSGQRANAGKKRPLDSPSQAQNPGPASNECGVLLKSIQEIVSSSLISVEPADVSEALRAETHQQCWELLKVAYRMVRSEQAEAGGDPFA